jgi:hypothetical protein
MNIENDVGRSSEKMIIVKAKMSYGGANNPGSNKRESYWSHNSSGNKRYSSPPNAGFAEPKFEEIKLNTVQTTKNQL